MPAVGWAYARLRLPAANRSLSLEPLRAQRPRLPLSDAGQLVEPPRRPAVARRHVAIVPARVQPAAALQPAEALRHGARAEAGVDGQGPAVSVVAGEVGHEGGEDLERREGEALSRVRRRHGRMVATTAVPRLPALSILAESLRPQSATEAVMPRTSERADVHARQASVSRVGEVRHVCDLHSPSACCNRQAAGGDPAHCLDR